MTRCDECPRPGHWHGAACWVRQAWADELKETESTDERARIERAIEKFDARATLRGDADGGART